MGALAQQMATLAENQAKQIAALEALARVPATDNFGSQARAAGSFQVIQGGKDERGLGFARAVRCLAIAKREARSPFDVADQLDKFSTVKYGDRLKSTIKALGESTGAPRFGVAHDGRAFGGELHERRFERAPQHLAFYELG